MTESRIARVIGLGLTGVYLTAMALYALSI
jgi:hypothetical protein